MSAAAYGENRAFDAPNYDKVITRLEIAGNIITVYSSQPATKPWISTLDETIYTAGSSQGPYFYAQKPEHGSFILCAETHYYDLEKSTPIRVEVTGLEPNTTYFYRVNDSAEINRIRTKPLPGTYAPFQFTVVSDSQGPYDPFGDVQLNKDRHSLETMSMINRAKEFLFKLIAVAMRKLGNNQHVSELMIKINRAKSHFFNLITVAMCKLSNDRHSSGLTTKINCAKGYSFNLITAAMRRQTAPDFSVHAGDLIEDGRYNYQWEKELFGQLKYYLLHAPVYVTMGNHEQHDNRFWKYFKLSLPENASQNKCAYYAWSWGDTHFIVLDTNKYWLELRDIDAITGSTTYQFTQEAVERLIHIVSRRVHKHLAAFADMPISRQDLESRLQTLGVTEDERRAILTETLLEPVETDRYEIKVRSPIYGRIAVLVLMEEARRDAQMRWLEEELRKNQDKRYIFVFSHYPLRYWENEPQICALLEKYGVTAAFSGHRHVYALHRANGVYYFQVGGQSDSVFSPLIKSEELKETFVEHRYGPHYMLVTVNMEHATVQCFTCKNEIFAEYRIPRR